MLINKYTKIKLEIKIYCNKHINNFIIYKLKYRSHIEIKQEYLKVILIFLLYLYNKINNMGGKK